MKKWFPIVIIGLFLLMNGEVTKKESRFSFRCSQDETAVELFNKDTGAFDTWEMCEHGCVMIQGSPACMLGEEPKKTSPEPYLWPVALIAAALLFMKRRR